LINDLNLPGSRVAGVSKRTNFIRVPWSSDEATYEWAGFLGAGIVSNSTNYATNSSPEHNASRRATAAHLLASHFDAVATGQKFEAAAVDLLAVNPRHPCGDAPLALAINDDLTLRRDEHRHFIRIPPRTAVQWSCACGAPQSYACQGENAFHSTYR
jgi:hypothetical protein